MPINIENIHENVRETVEHRQNIVNFGSVLESGDDNSIVTGKLFFNITYVCRDS